MEGRRKVKSVLRPLLRMQKTRPITHIRIVRQDRLVSSSVRPTPAAVRTSAVDSLDLSKANRSAGRNFGLNVKNAQSINRLTQSTWRPTGNRVKPPP